MDRRRFLARATAAATAAATVAAAPQRVFAQAAPPLRDRLLLDRARAEVARNDAALWRRDMVGLADFGLHSAQPRFHLCNMEAGTVESLLVSHGAGSDPEHDGWLNAYSNMVDSWATSRGAYVTWEWYEGIYGTSMRLSGLEADNSNVFDRAIVMHAATYATADHAARWGRLGRSNGCFAIAPDLLPGVLYQLSGGRLIVADSLGIGPGGEAVVAPPQTAVDFAAAVAQRQAEAAARAERAAESEAEGAMPILP